MRYVDFEDCDNDMLSMEDWDNICDRAMEDAMDRSYRNKYDCEDDDEW